MEIGRRAAFVLLNSSIPSARFGTGASIGLVAQHQAKEAIDQSGVGIRTADRDVWHDADVPFSHRLHELHYCVALLAQGLNTRAIGFSFRVTGHPDRRRVTEGAQTNGFGFARGLLDTGTGFLTRRCSHLVPC